jgi:hypothetical protein
VKVESNLIKFFAPDHSISRSTDRVEAKLSGVTTMEVVLTATGRDGLKDPGDAGADQGLADLARAAAGNRPQLFAGRGDRGNEPRLQRRGPGRRRPADQTAGWSSNCC